MNSPNKKFAENANVRLGESVQRLHWRYMELLEVSKLLHELYDEVRGRGVDPLLASSGDFSKKKALEFQRLQLATVDKNEAFHQQVYTTMGALCVVMQFVSLADIPHKAPTKTVTKFMEFLRRELADSSVMRDHVDTLLYSTRDYRGRFIDHPQDNVYFDYETIGYEDQFFVVYVTKKPTKKPHKHSTNRYPLSPEFRPTANVGTKFNVSPDNQKTFVAVHGLIGELLEV